MRGFKSGNQTRGSEWRLDPSGFRACVATGGSLMWESPVSGEPAEWSVVQLDYDAALVPIARGLWCDGGQEWSAAFHHEGGAHSLCHLESMCAPTTAHSWTTRVSSLVSGQVR